LKNLFFALLLALFLFFNTSFAAEGDPCSVDIVSSDINGPIAADADWRQIMYVKGNDGYLWQRAVIISQARGVELKEGEPIEIFGLAEPFSQVQVFVFARTDNDETDDDRFGLKKPGAGVCWETDPADSSGRFSLTMSSNFLWANIGNEQVIDAFFRTNMTWRQFLASRSDTNKNLFVGTHVNPRFSLLQGAEDPSEDCTLMCEEDETTQIVKAVSLRPDTIVGELLGNNFDDVGVDSVTVGRFPGAHTFYARTASGATGTIEDMRWIAQKAIMMEMIKRSLLGMENPGGTNPGLAIISADAFRSIFDELGDASPQTRLLVQNMHGLMTSVPYSPGPSPVNPPLPAPPPPPPPPLAITREDALVYLNPLFVLDSENKNDFLLEEVFFPEISDLVNWADDLERLLNFWTGMTEVNECLLADDTELQSNFEWRGDAGQPGDGLVQCEHTYVTGETPFLVLHLEGDVALSPDFSQAFIIASDKWFDTPETFLFSAEDDKILRYNYRFHSPFKGSFVAESCLKKDQIPDFASHIADELDLLPSEKEAIHTELSDALRLSKNFVQLRLADPKDISRSIAWKVDGKPVNIFQLFFETKEGECQTTDFGSFDGIVVPNDRIGFEVGILQ
jgi:hypothetical protein